jgi:hypothetical protein
VETARENDDCHKAHGLARHPLPGAPRVSRSPDPARPWRGPYRGRHRDPGRARHGRLPLPQKQHDARQRHRAHSGPARGRRDREPGDRWRGQQQCPQSFFGNERGRPAPQGGGRRSHGPGRPGHPGHGHPRRRPGPGLARTRPPDRRRTGRPVRPGPAPAGPGLGLQPGIRRGLRGKRRRGGPDHGRRPGPVPERPVHHPGLSEITPGIPGAARRLTGR